jgi:hypothetical protein
MTNHYCNITYIACTTCSYDLVDRATSCDQVIAAGIIHSGRDQRRLKATSAHLLPTRWPPAYRVQCGQGSGGIVVRIRVARVHGSWGDDHAGAKDHAVRIETTFVDLVDIRAPGRAVVVAEECPLAVSLVLVRVWHDHRPVGELEQRA